MVTLFFKLFFALTDQGVCHNTSLGGKNERGKQFNWLGKVWKSVRGQVTLNVLKPSSKPKTSFIIIVMNIWKCLVHLFIFLANIECASGLMWTLAGWWERDEEEDRICRELGVHCPAEENFLPLALSVLGRLRGARLCTLYLGSRFQI